MGDALYYYKTIYHTHTQLSRKESALSFLLCCSRLKWVSNSIQKRFYDSSFNPPPQVIGSFLVTPITPEKWFWCEKETKNKNV